MRVAVLGATGVVGQALVPVLAQRDDVHEVLAVSRRADAPPHPGARNVAADVRIAGLDP